MQTDTIITTTIEQRAHRMYLRQRGRGGRSPVPALTSVEGSTVTLRDARGDVAEYHEASSGIAVLAFDFT